MFTVISQGKGWSKKITSSSFRHSFSVFINTDYNFYHSLSQKIFISRFFRGQPLKEWVEYEGTGTLFVNHGRGWWWYMRCFSSSGYWDNTLSHTMFQKQIQNIEIQTNGILSIYNLLIFSGSGASMELSMWIRGRRK